MPNHPQIIYILQVQIAPQKLFSHAPMGGKFLGCYLNPGLFYFKFSVVFTTIQSNVDLSSTVSYG